MGNGKGVWGEPAAEAGVVFPFIEVVEVGDGVVSLAGVEPGGLDAGVIIKSEGVVAVDGGGVLKNRFQNLAIKG